MKQKARKITEADILEGAIKDFWGVKATIYPKVASSKAIIQF